MNVIFTDGSYKENPNKKSKVKSFCGAGVILINDKEIIDMKAISLPSRKNNYAELYGILKGLELLEKKKLHKEDTIIVTDSKYCITVLTDTMILEGKHKSLVKEWHTKEGKELKNQDLIKKIYKKVIGLDGNLKPNINFIHINSHMKEKNKDDLNKIIHSCQLAGYDISKDTAKNFIRMNNKVDELAKLAAKRIKENE